MIEMKKDKPLTCKGIVEGITKIDGGCFPYLSLDETILNVICEKSKMGRIQNFLDKLKLDYKTEKTTFLIKVKKSGK